eukprot:scaffold13767_cov97-Isochrysis_galbana.AAC.1
MVCSTADTDTGGGAGSWAEAGCAMGTPCRERATGEAKERASGEPSHKAESLARWSRSEAAEGVEGVEAAAVTRCSPV